ncbi:hypothetical protein NEHOM01_1704 [Nematocida homosporus]|uniref:uncharacterized protein n=1 Tax=Nematocida homosporus TaxID=1912981 RepID=UPI00221FE3E2|nr:uncharacterized protein NEHOM01_1704 [Nematocida homosporus]KAI5186784.1 hypothetical protein NEHOM01_1704 [Nematocida homosporus]
MSENNSNCVKVLETLTGDTTIMEEGIFREEITKMEKDFLTPRTPPKEFLRLLIAYIAERRSTDTNHLLNYVSLTTSFSDQQNSELDQRNSALLNQALSQMVFIPNTQRAMDYARIARFDLKESGKTPSIADKKVKVQRVFEMMAGDWYTLLVNMGIYAENSEDWRLFTLLEQACVEARETHHYQVYLKYLHHRVEKVKDEVGLSTNASDHTITNFLARERGWDPIPQKRRRDPIPQDDDSMREVPVELDWMNSYWAIKCLLTTPCLDDPKYKFDSTTDDKARCGYHAQMARLLQQHDMHAGLPEYNPNPNGLTPDEKFIDTMLTILTSHTIAEQAEIYRNPNVPQNQEVITNQKMAIREAALEYMTYLKQVSQMDVDKLCYEAPSTAAYQHLLELKKKKAKTILNLLNQSDANRTLPPAAEWLTTKVINAENENPASLLDRLKYNEPTTIGSSVKRFLHTMSLYALFFVSIFLTSFMTYISVMYCYWLSDFNIMFGLVNIVTLLMAILSLVQIMKITSIARAEKKSPYSVLTDMLAPLLLVTFGAVALSTLVFYQAENISLNLHVNLQVGLFLLSLASLYLGWTKKEEDTTTGEHKVGFWKKTGGRLKVVFGFDYSFEDVKAKILQWGFATIVQVLFIILIVVLVLCWTKLPAMDDVIKTIHAKVVAYNNNLQGQTP